MYLELPLLEKIINNKKYENLISPSATNQIVNILRSLNLKSIAIPAFLCEEVLASIKSLKIKIVFYELDKYFSPKINKEHFNCDCLYLCEFFGYPIKSCENLESYFLETQKPILFDRSHSLLAGSEENGDKIFQERSNIFFIYSLRKFLPTLNGALLVCKKLPKLYQQVDQIKGLKNYFKPYILNYIKYKMVSIGIARNLLKQRTLYLINNNDQYINGNRIDFPSLHRENLKLGYYSKFLDNRNKKYLNSTFLNKLGKIRSNDISIMENDLLKVIDLDYFQISIPKFKYGVPYGIPVTFDKNLSKKFLEKNFTKKILKLNNNTEVILWPYNTNKSYSIGKFELKSVLFLTPRISYV